MFGILVNLGILAASYLVSRWLRPDQPRIERERHAFLKDFNLPRAQEGDPIPLFYGKVRIRGPMVVWTGGFSAENPNFPTQFKYHLSMHMILGIPGNGVARLRKFYIGEQVIVDSFAAGDVIVTVGPAPEYYGRIAFYEGSQTQTASTAADVWELAGEDPTLFAPYRGQAWVLITGQAAGGQSRHWFAGHDPNLEPYSFEVQATETDADLWTTPAPDPIDSGDANPVDVLWDILTNDWARLGIPKAKVDGASFRAAAETLADERHGVSLVIYDQNDASRIVYDLIRQIDGVLYNDTATGKYTLKLIRNDYVVLDLPVFDETNVVSLSSYTVTSIEETYNEVRVNYTSRNKGYKTRPAFAQNAASIAAMGKKRTLTIDFPWVTNSGLAGRLAKRELAFVSQPITKIRIVVNRDAYDLNPGDAFVFSWPGGPTVTDSVMRVVKADVGELGDRKIVIDAVEDRFSDEYADEAFDEDDTPVFAPVEPDPLEAQNIGEAARWFQLKAFNAGRIPSADTQHVHYLAARADGSPDSSFQGQVATDETTFVADTETATFLGSALVAVAYARTLDPYDTTVGLQLDTMDGLFAPVDATPTQIRAGANLILVGAEIMGFETATALLDGGGDTIGWLLEDVWRGLLDTATVAHVVGERAYLLSSTVLHHVGSAGLDLDDVVAARIIPRTTGAYLPDGDATEDTFTITQRTLRPYPPATLILDGGVSPAPLEEEGVTVGYRPRSKRASILRGDDSSESLTDGTTWDLVGRKGTAAAELLAASIASPSAVDQALAQIGHGTLTVGVRSVLDISGTTYYSWTTPELDITAYRWRNLLRNNRFGAAASPTFWTVTGGDVVASSGASGLGAGGSYAESDGASADCDFYQTVNATGYLPPRLRAILDFYGRGKAVDADDTITVDLIELNAADGVLATTTYGPTGPTASQWDKHTIDVANLNADTVKIKVRVLLDSVGGGDTDPSGQVTEFILRLGQIGDQLLLNPDFEGGLAAATPTSWTLDSGAGFQLLGTTQYNGPNYIRGVDGAATQISQIVAIPAGYKWSTAVMEFAVMNDAADDTATVTLQTLDGGGTPITSTVYGPAAQGSTSVWSRKRLTLDVGAAVSVKVIVAATRVTGTPLNVCFDDFDLRLHKQLDVGTTNVLDFDEPVAQPLPQTVREWEASYPAIAAPEYGLWAGDSYDGVEGSEPSMTSTVGVLTAGKFVGVWSGTAITTDALEFVEADDADIRALSQDQYANFGEADTFSALVVLRCDEESFGTARGLLGRMGATGWSLEINSSGVGVAKLVGASGTKTATGTTVLTDGAIHYVAIVYNPGTDLLHLIDEAGDHTTSTASGLGEFALDDLTKFRIGRADEAQATITGQFARVYLWGETALTNAEIASLWTHATDPSGELTVTRTGQVMAAVVGADALGALVSRFAASDVVLGYAPALAADETGYGLLVNDTQATLTPSTWMRNATYWVTASGTTVAQRAAVGVEGYKNATSILGTSSHRVELAPVTLSASAVVYVRFWARAATAITMRVSLTSSAGVVKDTEDVVLTTLWAQYTVTLAWDAATATGKVYFHPSASGASQTIYMSGPTYVSQSIRAPIAYPVSHGGTPGSVTKTLVTCATSVLVEQFNTEGEIMLEGVLPETTPATAATLIDVYNNADNKDRRIIQIQADADAELLHYDATPASNSSVIAAFDWTDPWQLRARWARVGLLDQAAAMAGLRLGHSTTATYGRAAAWTPSTTALTEIHIGHDAVADNLCPNVLLRRVTLSTREARLLASDLV